MENNNKDIFVDDLTFNQKNNFSSSEVKNKTIDFLSNEQFEDFDDEKTDVKEKKNVDDFLNFHEESYQQQDELLKSNPILLPTIEKKEEEPTQEVKIDSSEPKVQEDVYLNPYAMTKETNNEKFISSEDLLTSEFKDTIPTEEVIAEETPKNIHPTTITEEAPKISQIEEPKQAPVPLDPRPKETQIEAEKIFKSIGLDAWFKKDRLHPKVESLIYWRDVKKSGVVFGIGMAVLLAMSMFSLISVFAYLSLMTLLGTISFRIYKTVMSAVQKTSEGHPFKEVLDFDLTLSQERAQQIAGVIVTHINAYVAELRRLFLVDDLVDSLKFGLLLYLMTYIGAIFNGMTVIILAYVAMFTLPKVYETNKQNIDQYLDLVRSKIVEITDKVKAAIPLGKKDESPKDK